MYEHVKLMKKCLLEAKCAWGWHYIPNHNNEGGIISLITIITLSLKNYKCDINYKSMHFLMIQIPIWHCTLVVLWCLTKHLKRASEIMQVAALMATKLFHELCKQHQFQCSRFFISLANVSAKIITVKWKIKTPCHCLTTSWVYNWASLFLLWKVEPWSMYEINVSTM